MTTRQLLLDVGRCLRAAAAPLLTLGVLTVARTAHAPSPSSANIDHLVLVAWRLVVAATLLWLLAAMTWAASRPGRDRRAFARLQHLRESAAPTHRALVHVQTAVWSSTAGQHVVVVNVATGSSHRVWLPETTVPGGAFVVLERNDGGVSVVDWMNAHQVEAGHRHEARRARPTAANAQCPEHARSRQEHEAAAELVREIEEFLKCR